MIEHIKQLKRLIDLISDEPTSNNIYIESPELKLNLIKNALAELVFKIDFNEAPNSLIAEIENKRDKYMEQLNSRYHYIIGGGPNDTRKKPDFTYQLAKGYIPWRLHDTHFHPALDDYIKCPMTSIPELGEFLDKIMEGMEQ